MTRSKDERQRAAARARVLMADETFTAVKEDLKERMVAIFLGTKASEIEAREEAHAIVRALGMIDQLIQSDIDEGKLLDKQEKERDRG